MKSKTLVLIDGNSILHRAYHAMPRFEAEGKLVNALYGFISILFSAIEKHRPDFLAVAFDVKGPTFRDKIFKDYKAKRVKPPQEFYDQIPDVWEFLQTMEIPLLTREGYEADDLIGTIVKKINGRLRGNRILIISGDQDALQLVDERTSVAMPAMGKSKETIYDANAVKGRLGLSPSQVVDYKALSGDSSDNIPGVRGIGDKTAQALLREWGSLDQVYEKADQDEGGFLSKFSPSVLAKLKAGRDNALLSHDLARIRTDAAIDFELKKAEATDFDMEALRQFLEKYHFRSLIKRIPESRRKAGRQEKLF